jgi:hypothetical protein
VELSSGDEYITKTRQEGGKNLKRQHSQANQKYHEYAPSVSCGAHSGSNASPSFLEIFLFSSQSSLPRPKPLAGARDGRFVVDRKWTEVASR